MRRGTFLVISTDINGIVFFSDDVPFLLLQGKEPSLHLSYDLSSKED
jgi:hypothetical protein